MQSAGISPVARPSPTTLAPQQQPQVGVSEGRRDPPLTPTAKQGMVREIRNWQRGAPDRGQVADLLCEAVLANKATVYVHYYGPLPPQHDRYLAIVRGDPPNVQAAPARPREPGHTPAEVRSLTNKAHAMAADQPAKCRQACQGIIAIVRHSPGNAKAQLKLIGELAQKVLPGIEDKATLDGLAADIGRALAEIAEAGPLTPALTRYRDSIVAFILDQKEDLASRMKDQQDQQNNLRTARVFEQNVVRFGRSLNNGQITDPETALQSCKALANQTGRWSPALVQVKLNGLQKLAGIMMDWMGRRGAAGVLPADALAGHAALRHILGLLKRTDVGDNSESADLQRAAVSQVQGWARWASSAVRSSSEGDSPTKLGDAIAVALRQ